MINQITTIKFLECYTKLKPKLTFRHFGNKSIILIFFNLFIHNTSLMLSFKVSAVGTKHKKSFFLIWKNIHIVRIMV